MRLHQYKTQYTHDAVAVVVGFLCDTTEVCAWRGGTSPRSYFTNKIRESGFATVEKHSHFAQSVWRACDRTTLRLSSADAEAKALQCTNTYTYFAISPMNWECITCARYVSDRYIFIYCERHRINSRYFIQVGNFLRISLHRLRLVQVNKVAFVSQTFLAKQKMRGPQISKAEETWHRHREYVEK